MSGSEKKKSRYNRLYEQLYELLKDSPDSLAQLATINAILYHKIPYIFWAGIYFLRDNKLTVGPYQGPLACQILPNPRGVCWQAVLDKKPVIIKNVDECENHVACDARSKSEIVLPIFNQNNEVIAVLDADSDSYDSFDMNDEAGLQKIIGLLKL